MTTLDVPAETATRTAAPRFTELLTSEWTKLRTLRSTRWTLTAAAIMAVGFCILATALTTSNWKHASAATKHDVHINSIGLILQPGALWAQIALCVLGVLVIAGEYSTGMIRSSLLAVPTRTPVLLAKISVLAIVTFVVSEIIAIVSFVIGNQIVHRNVSGSLGDQHVVRAIIGYGAYLVTAVVFAVCIGAIMRHVAAGIVVVLGLSIALPMTTSAIPGRTGTWVQGLLPGGNGGQTIMSSGADHTLLNPWLGIAIAIGWTALALVVACVQLRRRDV